MSKTLWHTIQIKVPAEMIELTKTGKVSIKKTLTKTFNISNSQKKPAIKLIPADINKPQIVNDGKEWNVEELKSQMVKANALAKKNKGRDITKSESGSKLEKFKKAVVDSAREGVWRNLDKKYNELVGNVKKMKSIKLNNKQTKQEKEIIAKKMNLMFLQDKEKQTKKFYKRQGSKFIHPPMYMIDYDKIIAEEEPLKKLEIMDKELENWKEYHKELGIVTERIVERLDKRMKANRIRKEEKIRKEKLEIPEKPKPRKKDRYAFNVETKKGPTDFTFSRDFKYDTIKTDTGYTYIFNNEKDLNTALDLTLFVSDYKNPKLYKWGKPYYFEPDKIIEKVETHTQKKDEQPPPVKKVLNEKTSLHKPTKKQFVENYKDLTKEEQSKILIKQLTVGKKPKKIDPDIFFDQLPTILSKSASRALPLLVNLGFEPTDLTTMFGAKSFDFYPTPNKCLDEIYDKIPRYYQRELKLLEGTAGLGGVSYYFYKKGFEVTSNEFNTQLFDIMKKILPPEIKTTNNDFFDITQIKDDAIFLNPPFMKGVQLKFLLKALQLIRESKTKNKIKFIFFISPWLTSLIGEQYLTWNDIVKPKGQIQRTTFKLYVEELLGREINVNTVLDGDDEEFNDNFSFDLMTQLENECEGFGGTKSRARMYMIEIHD